MAAAAQAAGRGMAEPDGTRGRAEVWRPWVAARRPPAWMWPALLRHLAPPLAQQLRAWAKLDVGPGRLVPWLAVAFGGGIIVYFAAEQEPAPWAAGLLLVAAVAASIVLRTRPFAFPIAVCLAAAAAGFATVTLKRALIAHPVLAAPVWSVEIAGFVEIREERERSDRIVVRVERITGPRLNEKLERVRVSVRKGTAPAVGTFVEFKARLSPPLEPLRPGGYDFARDLYFQRIGASGFVLGRIGIAPAPSAPTLWLRYAAVIDGMRDVIDKRIRAVLPGDAGAIASALITGKRDTISTQLNEAMYISSIAHVLSISGYHMALVAGIVFFLLRALLALQPAFADHRPIKKWAAFAALLAAGFYLLLSGAEVATQRSFIMVAIVLIGVMVDRPTLTLRTLTAAALGVLLLAPEAIVHPSFQMSFAATLALVAGYQGGLPWMSRARETPLGVRVALWGGREIVGLVLVSLLAGTATIPFIAYHFHRVSAYGLLANLLAMPLVSVLVMPAGITGLVTMPFGIDGFFWRLMGSGIEWMMTIALWVSSFPGALGRIAAFGSGPLLLCAFGLVVLCLLKSPLRLVGGILIGIAAVLMVRAPQPDVLIAAGGGAVAIRGTDGRLSMVRWGSDAFAFRAWLAADADPRDPNDKNLGNGIRCDEAGCIGRLRDGALIAIARTTAAFEEDCRRAALVVTPREPPADCPTMVVDRDLLRRFGAVTLRRLGNGFEMTPARPPGYNRPWAAAAAPSAGTVEPGQPLPPRGRDATPRVEDLDPGD
jgi:competence protein ComEC